MSGDTPILMGDGRTKAIADVRVGDEVYGTVKVGRYRRFVKTSVLNHWRRFKRAYRILLADGSNLVASADHRFLTQRGWKHVMPPVEPGRQRPHLTPNNDLLGTGGFSEAPNETLDYMTGYVCGIVRGDGLLGSYTYHRRQRRRRVPTSFPARPRRFRGACSSKEIPQRRLLSAPDEFLFQAAVAGRKELRAIRSNARANVERIQDLVSWPSDPNDDWYKGYLAGIFDAEGSYSGAILRICNTDNAIIARITEGLERFGFDFAVEFRPRNKPIHVVRVRRGLAEHLRFFHTADPAITRKRSIAGQAIKNDARLRVVSVEPLGVALPLYDITTGTGDFIANGVVSHNCYARPTHQYLDWGAGTDFERKIVVKTNAPELLRKELSRKSWKGDTIIFSGVTDS